MGQENPNEVRTIGPRYWCGSDDISLLSVGPNLILRAVYQCLSSNLMTVPQSFDPLESKLNTCAI